MTNPPPDDPAEAAASPDPAAAAEQPASSDHPTQVDQPAGAAPPEPPQPAPAPPPVAPAPAAGGYFGGPPYPPGMPYPAGGQYPPGAPFVPVPRPPRMPWVNPARRGLVAGVAAAVAVVLFGGGIGIGIAIAPSGNDHGPRFERGDGGYPGLHPGQFGRLPHAQFPGKFPQPAPPGGSSATPSSSPTR